MKGSIVLLLLLVAHGLLFAQAKPAETAQQTVEINFASKSELEALPGIGPDRAGWIIATRRRNGAFRCVEELRAMPRLSDRQFKTLRPLVFVTDPDSRCEAKPREAN